MNNCKLEQGGVGDYKEEGGIGVTGFTADNNKWRPGRLPWLKKKKKTLHGEELEGDNFPERMPVG